MSIPPFLAVRPGSPTTLLDAVAAPKAAYSVRKLRAAYAGNALQVTRTSDSTTANIGFDSSGNLDTTTLAQFCSGTTGLVSKWYDQSGNGADLSQATQANMFTIYASATVQTQNTRPALRSTNQARSLKTAGFTAYTGSAMSGAIVGTIQSDSNAVASPRYLSVYGSAVTDNGDNQGAALIERNGGATVTQGWQSVHHNGTGPTATVGGTYNKLQQVQAVLTLPSTLSLSADGTAGTPSGTGTDSVFSATNIGIGYSGNANISSTDMYVAEAVVWFSALSSADQTTVRSNQKAYFATS